MGLSNLFTPFKTKHTHILTTVLYKIQYGMTQRFLLMLNNFDVFFLSNSNILLRENFDKTHFKHKYCTFFNYNLNFFPSYQYKTTLQYMKHIHNMDTTLATTLQVIYYWVWCQKQCLITNPY